MSLSDTDIAVGRVYSDAILALAEERGAADELFEELTAVAALLDENAALRSYLSSPLVDAEERRELLEKAFRGRASDLLADTLQVLNRKGRLGFLPAVVETYEKLLDERRGRIEVHVTTAVALDEAQRAKIRTALRNRLGLTPMLRESVQPALIGGIVFRIGDRKIDDSIATRLRTLSKALAARTALEVHSGKYVTEV
jgi:F-type H+-transporting ATPase subunit delta